MRRRALEALLFFPDRARPEDLRAPRPGIEDVDLPTADGERLHGWWVAAGRAPALGHVLFCHGNAGNVADRLPYAELLAGAGLDVLLFDPRGYGCSSGRPSVKGTALDARAARASLLGREEVDPGRVLILGESLGGAVALELALEHPPAGLVLQSTFTSIRDMARVHYPVLPAAAVPDAYPSARRIRHLRAPLLVLHGARDEIVPVAQGEALHAAAPEPKRLRILEHSGHNDVLLRDGPTWLEAIRDWAAEVTPSASAAPDEIP